MTSGMGRKDRGGVRWFSYPVPFCFILEDTRVVIEREARLSQMKTERTSLLLGTFLTKVSIPKHSLWWVEQHSFPLTGNWSEGTFCVL